jgi:hypothetical protein
MQFNPAIHTKEFLIANPHTTCSFAEKSSEFAESEHAQDVEILLIRNTEHLNKPTIAHYLAEYQPQWINTAAARNDFILRLTSEGGVSVAHYLAKHQPAWVFSDTASKFNPILMVKNHSEWSVAHALFFHQSEWINTAAANDKRILTIDKRGEILAAYISLHASAQRGCSIEHMAMKLISQGAAYKHSKIVEASVGRSILKQSEVLIEESIEPLIALKQAKALYSTCFYCAELVKPTDYKLLNKGWDELIHISKSHILEILSNNPELWDLDHTVDIFCEPADALVKHLKAERNLTDLVTVGISSNESEYELTAKSGLY